MAAQGKHDAHRSSRKLAIVENYFFKATTGTIVTRVYQKPEANMTDSLNNLLEQKVATVE